MLLFLILSVMILSIFYISEKSKINAITTFIITILITYLIIFPKSSIDSVINGTDLFMKSVFPTLFPFLILTNILINYGGIDIFGKLLSPIISKPLGISKNSIFPLLISFICGYPLGIKYLNDMYNQQMIKKDEFIRMTNIASNASPLFIIGTVGVSILENKILGYILLFSNYISCLLMSFILPTKNKTLVTIVPIEKNTSKNNFGNILKSSLENSLKTCAMVGGFIILFSLLKEIILNNFFTQVLTRDLPILKSIIIGILEITNGIKLLSDTNISMQLKLSLISFFCSFSGLCIILQCYSFVYKNNKFKINRYIFLKFVQGVISFILTFLICTFTI